jgi:hypothetical protein
VRLIVLAMALPPGSAQGGMEEKAGLWKRTDGVWRAFTVATSAGKSSHGDQR